MAEREVHGLTMTVKFNQDDVMKMAEELVKQGKFEPVVHAHWIPVIGRWNDKKNYKCSVCKQLGGGKYAYLLPRCPHCGAHMDEEV